MRGAATAATGGQMWDGRTDERTNDNRCAVQCSVLRVSQATLQSSGFILRRTRLLAENDFHNLEAAAHELPQDSIIINYLLLGPFLETPRKILSKTLAPPTNYLCSTVERNRTWVYFYILNSQTVDSDGDTKEFQSTKLSVTNCQDTAGTGVTISCYHKWVCAKTDKL